MRRQPTPTYTEAKEAQALAREIIAEHYDDLRRHEIAISFVFTRKTSHQGGRVILGKAAKQNELQRFLGRQHDTEEGAIDAVIVLSAVEWAILPEQTRRALVDHQLCRLEMQFGAGGEALREPDGRPKLRVRPPDIQEFREILDRHGFWSEELAEARDVIERASAELPGQTFLPGTDPSADRRASVMDAVAAMAPKPGSGVTAVSIETPDGLAATLTANDGPRLRKAATELRKQAAGAAGAEGAGS